LDGIPIGQVVEWRLMKQEDATLKTFAIVLFVMAAYAGAAYAHGGAQPMPQVGYSDLPSYHPNPGLRHFKRTSCCRRHLSTAHPG
jgi:hypothetical protein